jgi:trigger factor
MADETPHDRPADESPASPESGGPANGERGMRNAERATRHAPSGFRVPSSEFRVPSWEAPADAAPSADAAPAETPAQAKPEGPPLAVEVKVEDAGVCKKRLTVTIPREEIARRFEKRYDELQEEALVPGFRPGRAPRRLVEKRFHRAVTEELGLALAAEGLKQALEGHDLKVIGEPDFDPETAKVPDDGPMSFSVDLEVRPEFTLPETAGIPVEVSRPAVTDEAVEAAIGRLRGRLSQSRTLPPDAEAKAGDVLTADLAVRVGGETVIDLSAARLPVAAIVLEGVPLETFADLVTGAKAGEDRSADITLGQGCERADLCGKAASVTVAVKEVSRMEPPEDAALVRESGYESLQALRDGLRRQLEAEADQEYARRQEDAVHDWLLRQVQFELPADLAKRHAEHVARRAMVNLLYRGVSVEEVRRRETQIRDVTDERATRDLKLFFILDAIAEKEKVEVTDAEVDARVRLIAMQQGRREDRVRLEMQERGTLDGLRGQIRDDKAVRLLLAKAAIREAAPTDAVAPEAPPSKAGQAGSASADAGQAGPASADAGQAGPAPAGAAAPAETPPDAPPPPQGDDPGPVEST